MQEDFFRIRKNLKNGIPLDFCPSSAYNAGRNPRGRKKPVGKGVQSMISFESDYIAGAHPEILRRLTETNLECLTGYGEDEYCRRAKQKIRDAVGLPDAEIFFLTGGTQTNAVVISAMLSDWEGVVAAKTGHVSTHEAGDRKSVV